MLPSLVITVHAIRSLLSVVEGDREHSEAQSAAQLDGHTPADLCSAGQCSLAPEPGLEVTHTWV